jgi:hypothetical protein
MEITENLLSKHDFYFSESQKQYFAKQ